jgi:hypothetical protein
MAPPSLVILVKDPLGEKFPKNPVWVNSQKSFTKSDEACDMKKRIWHELMQLHAIDKEKPTKEFVGRKR